MSAAEHPTGGTTFQVGGKAFRAILVISTTPVSLALYECATCAVVVTDPRRHAPACGAPSRPRLRGVGVAKTIPLRPRPE